MDIEQYLGIVPREAPDAEAKRLFSFARIRSGGSTRFHPGDGAKLHFANRDVDTLEIPGVPSGFLKPGDAVSATYKGKVVFLGDVATVVENRGRGADATQDVTCVGPWSRMQRLVYRQYWKTGPSAWSCSSRLILNQSSAGEPQTLDQALLEIASSGSAACGYEVSAADVSVSAKGLPFDECRDVTVADAIKRELRFFPKAVCRFDYGADGGPRLKIARGNATKSAGYVADIPKSAREYVYNAHPITGVDLEIETTGSVDGVEYHQISHQTAGDASAGNPDCLYATLQVKGFSSSTARQSFVSVTEDIPDDLNLVSWWKSKHPRLAAVAENAIAISDGRRSPSAYPRIAASTAGEIREAGLHCEVSTFTCKATITTADDKEEDILLTLNFLTTDALGTEEEPKTYTWTAENSSESGEYVPEGLAATILADRSGTLLSERMTIRLGDTLPALGDAIVEADGTVYLQRFDVDCGNLTADLAFGVPEHLTPEDMAALLTGFRNKCTSKSTVSRVTGKPGDDGETIKLGGIPPLSSSEFAPGRKALTTIASNVGGGGRIRLDSSKLGAGRTMQVRTLTIHGEDGDTSFKVLADADIEITNGCTTPSQTVETIVVAEETYDTATHQFRTVRKKIKVLAAEDVPASDSDIVFTATSHTEEHGTT